MKGSRCLSSSRQVLGALCFPQVRVVTPVCARARARIRCPMPSRTSPALLCAPQVESEHVNYLAIFAARLQTPHDATDCIHLKVRAAPPPRIRAAATPRLPDATAAAHAHAPHCSGRDFSSDATRTAPQVRLTSTVGSITASKTTASTPPPSDPPPPPPQPPPSSPPPPTPQPPPHNATGASASTAATSPPPHAADAPPPRRFNHTTHRHRYQPPPPAATTTSRRHQQPPPVHGST